MSTESHEILDGKARLYRRQGSRYWQCATYLDGRNHRASTRQVRLALALEVAREWALDRLAEQDMVDVECSRSGNVLEIEFLENGSKVIVNSMLGDQPLPLQGRQEAVQAQR